jgi:Zn-dependent M28 family amino/carboxypeptidase
MNRKRIATGLMVLACALCMQAQSAPLKPDPATQTLANSVRTHMDTLASDAMLGRGSATVNEVAAATYIAGELKRYGIAPAGDAGGYIQKALLPPGAGPHGERTTVNVIGMLKGSDPRRAAEVILLTAHLDHLGVGPKVNGDAIYNGADDDASGVCAVLEFARILGKGPRPKRTVLFVLFGSEELGSLGAAWFREHPPLPMKDIVANLEFEMIGRDDPAVPSHTLWLTGYERSNLGPTLAQHGARLVADPHPTEQFFTRSDNYGLAKQGIIAHTVSSFGLHADYHQPSDEISRIDFAHMDEAIGSLVAPVGWLINSDFRPTWNAGQRP